MRSRYKYVQMEVQRESALMVLERWDRNYRKLDGTWIYHGEAVHNALLALGESKSAVQISKAVGNTSWALNCYSCGDSCEQAVRIGQDSSESKVYCQTCIAEAADLLGISTSPVLESLAAPSASDRPASGSPPGSPAPPRRS